MDERSLSVISSLEGRRTRNKREREFDVLKR